MATTAPGDPMTSNTEDYWTRVKDVWANDGPQIRFLFVWTLANCILFFSTVHKYRTSTEFELVYDTLGEGVTIARGCGALLKFNCSLILVPVLRNLLLILRETPINSLFPIDKGITFHRKCGYFISIAAAVHTAAHLFNFTTLSKKTAGELTILLRPDFETGMTMNNWLFQTLPGFTGIVIIMCMLFMYSSAALSVRRPQFEIFWYTHHLFIVFFFCLLLHGAGAYLEPPTFWMYFLAPGGLYAIERFLRWYKGAQNTILVDAIEHPSRVLEVRFQKASFNYKSGMYLFLNCPYIYKHEWHPFTITSCPSDPYVSVHIRMVGDWTQSLGHLLIKSEHRDEILRTSTIDGMPILRVDGPFGAASDQVYEFKTVMLIGAGIGVTPFASILKDIRHRLQSNSVMPLKNVYFYWISRDKEAFEWFSDLIAELEHENINNFLHVNCFLTGGLKVNDIRSVMYDDSLEDAITGLEAETQFGRPNWPKIFADMVKVHENETVGIFFCGPRVLSLQLHKLARRHTTANGTKMVYSKENF